VAVILEFTIGATLMGIVGALASIPFISLSIFCYKSMEEQK